MTYECSIVGFRVQFSHRVISPENGEVRGGGAIVDHRTTYFLFSEVNIKKNIIKINTDTKISYKIKVPTV